MAWQGYKLLSKLGEGGMATVYKGLQESLQRPVAIKVLAADLNRHPEIRERFDKESLIIARLNHPHIIHVIDKGLTNKGRPYFVMEYVSGMTLEEAINRGKLDFSGKLDVLVQTCKAIGYAHKHGVIHRDIKPANILLDQDAQVRMADFGIAHFYDKQAQPGLHTEMENIMGTSAYMAPELVENPESASVASDIFALGILMYELFTGVCPQDEIPPPSQFEPDLHPGLNDLIMHCIATEPAARPASVAEVQSNLLQFSSGGHLSEAQRRMAAYDAGDDQSQLQLVDVLQEDEAGNVYLYEDVEKQRLIVLRKLALSAGGFKEQLQLSRLSHQHLARVIEVRRDQEGMTFVSEYVQGSNLGEQFLSTVDSLQVLGWVIQAAEGLAFCHQQHIFHRNLRPANILLTEEGVVKLVDFGLDSHPNDPLLAEVPDEVHCLPPEQLDIFRLGAVFYQGLAGLAPGFDKSGLKLAPLLKFPQRLQDTVSKMLQPEAGAGYLKMESVLIDLRSLARRLRSDKEVAQIEAIRQRATREIKQAEKAVRPPVNWRRWTFRILLTLIIAEEIALGIGYRTLAPYAIPVWEQIQTEPWFQSLADQLRSLAG